MKKNDDIRTLTREELAELICIGRQPHWNASEAAFVRYITLNNCFLSEFRAKFNEITQQMRDWRDK